MLRETVRIVLTVSAWKDLSAKVVDIQNAYITAPVTEKIWKVLGREFGEYADRKAIVVRDIYVLKSARAVFWNHLVDCMHHLEFLPCPDDPDIWMKLMVRPDDGFNY